MLIVGDVAYQKTFPKESADSLEIIHLPENKEKVKKIFGLEESKSVPMSKHSTLYFSGQPIKVNAHTKEFNKNIRHKSIILISTEESIYLRVFLRNAMAYNNLRIANPVLNFLYLSARVSSRHFSYKKWLSRLKQVHNLHPIFVKNMISIRKLHQYSSLVENLIPVFKEFKDINPKKPVEMNFDHYHKYDILQAIGSNLLVSPYKKFTIESNNNYINSYMFNQAGASMKMVFILEYFYLKMIDNVFIPERLVYDKVPQMKNWKGIFIECIMQYLTTTSETRRDKIYDYVYNNVFLIIQNFDPTKIENFILADQSKQLKPQQ